MLLERSSDGENLKAFSADHAPAKVRRRPDSITIMHTSNQITRVPFHNVVTFALAAGVSNLLVAPGTLSGRTTTIADAFNLYRLARFRFRLIPNTLVSEVFTAGYTADTVDGTLTFTSVAESNCATTFGGQMSVPSNWADVPPSLLKGALPWYKAVPGTPSAWEETAGVINFASTNSASTTTLCLEYDGVMEFSSPIDPTLTPAIRRALQLRRKKEELLKILAVPLEVKTGVLKGLPSMG